MKARCFFRSALRSAKVIGYTTSNTLQTPLGQTRLPRILVGRSFLCSALHTADDVNQVPPLVLANAFICVLCAGAYKLGHSFFTFCAGLTSPFVRLVLVIG